ncbi:MAG: toll/interleukin-1 receptor domain-containing protein [Betaproteobacteria bacterium]|nr:toll/interleukin-1 receptor domain-containing protein [Betaproteobacteria bacterium]
MKVFVSYSSADGQLAEKIHLALEGVGFSAFLDRKDLPDSESYDGRLEEAVKRSDFFCISNQS